MPNCFRPDGPTSPRASCSLHGKRVVLAVARLVPIKNVALLIDALAIAASSACPDAHLLLVGDGPEAGALAHRADDTRYRRRP